MLVAGALVAGAGAAFAQSVNLGTEIIFYSYTSGNARGNDFRGGTARRLSEDGPGRAPQNFEGRVRRNRTLQSDETNAARNTAYIDPAYYGPFFGTASNANYHTDVNWAAASGSGRNDNGYVSAER